MTRYYLVQVDFADGMNAVDADECAWAIRGEIQAPCFTPIPADAQVLETVEWLRARGYRVEKV